MAAVRVKTMGSTMAMLLALLLAVPAGAAPLEALLQRREAGEEMVWLDVREAAHYEQAHLPNAIGIPSRLLPLKRLPALGTVVVVGDGVDRAAVDAAVAVLARTPGVRPEVLDGGFPAWQESGQPVVTAAGGPADATGQVTLQDVTAAAEAGADLELVDLRRAPKGETVLERGAPARLARTVARTAPDDRALAVILQRWRANPARMLVLVDEGDGRAERLVRRLRAGGVYRVVALLGGAHATANEGQRGMGTLETERELSPGPVPAAKGGVR